MKTFLISVLLLSLIVFGTIINTVYLNRTCEKICETLDSLSEEEGTFSENENLEVIVLLQDFFDKNDLLFNLSFDKQMLDQAKINLVHVQNMAKNECFEEYLIAKIDCQYAFSSMKDTLQLRFGDIF